MTINTALQATQTFFATRAAGREDRFAHNDPQYARAMQKPAPVLTIVSTVLGANTVADRLEQWLNPWP